MAVPNAANTSSRRFTLYPFLNGTANYKVRTAPSLLPYAPPAWHLLCVHTLVPNREGTRSSDPGSLWRLIWSRRSPARSLAPVRDYSLVLVPLAKCVVVDVPKGLSVAFSPSALRLTPTLVICVVLPSGLTFKSLKVVAFREEVIIFSEKVAVRLAEGATPVALAAGRCSSP